jgi:hypothetical protein
MSPPQTIRWQDCEDWAKASVERTRKSLASSSDQTFNKFAELLLDPKFVVTSDAESVTLSNDVMTYRASQPMPLDAQQRKMFFTYDRLNAYRKALAERKVPPTPQIAVDDELDKREFAPGVIDFSLKTPNGTTAITIKAHIVDLTPDELQFVTDVIEKGITVAPGTKR